MASKIKSKQRKSIPSSPISPCVVRTSKIITEIDIVPLKKEIEELKKQLLLIKNENKVTVDELRKEVNSLTLSFAGFFLYVRLLGGGVKPPRVFFRKNHRDVLKFGTKLRFYVLFIKIEKEN